ncbi:MAG: dephospho-CoA kinase [bacterium]
MIKIAVTGGIACGKSVVGQIIAREGVPVCEADEVGHEVLERNPEVREKVIREFGREITGSDGLIDRTALGRLVFADPGRREALNALVHPAIMGRIADWVKSQATGANCVAVIIPLLYEIGAEKEWDKVICVGAPEAEQLQRLTERGLSPDEAQARIAAQMSLATKMERADFVIYNCGSKALLEEQTKQVMRNIRGE